jgi:hypothetical protein
MSEELQNLVPPTTETSPNMEESEIRYESSKTYSKQSKVHGIGVFAKQKINASDIIEVFPIVPLSFRTSYQGDARVIDYSVIKQCECEECKRHGYVIFLRLGYGGIYNHQDNFNAEIIMDYKNLIGTCKAISSIDEDSEIFINYGINYRFPNGKISIRS